jgi:hypothetical protein
MTVAPGTDVAAHNPNSAGAGIEGLEDVEVSDVMLPRLQLDHKKALFRDNLSKVEYPELDLIILGLIKQRIMWRDETEDKEKPLCKSPDHAHGFPNVRDDTPKDKQFPWGTSNFNPADFPPGGPTSINGLVTLPCDSCIFKEWDKPGWKIPPCTEQHTYAVLYNSNPGEGNEPNWVSALLTFQKTGIKASKSYISSFVQAGQPMFTVRTRITLTAVSRGTVDYAVPTFYRKDPTDSSEWPNFGDSFRSIRTFVRQPPRSQDDDEDFTDAAVVPSDNFNTGPAAPAPSAGNAPAAPPQPPATPAPQAPPTPAAAAPVPATPGDDDLPF